MDIPSKLVKKYLERSRILLIYVMKINGIRTESSFITFQILGKKHQNWHIQAIELYLGQN